MSVSYLTDTSNPASQPKSIRVYDLYLDGEIIPPLIPGSITPGPDNTFLHTNNLSQVVWQPFSASNITGGNDYDILTKDPIIGWQATQQLQNQNLPDPLIVDEIQANTSVTTTTVQAGIGNIPTINSTSISAVTNVDTGTVNATTLNSQTLSSVNIRDTSLSLGTAGQYLQKSNPGNALVWGSIPIASPNNIAVSLPTAYFFPTTLSNINLNAVFGTSQQYTLASPTINLNNVATEKVHLTFWANVRVSDSATSFNIYVVSGGVQMFSFRTQKIQAGDTNHYTTINISANLDIPAGGQLTIQSQRAIGTGTMQVDPTGFNPYYGAMFSVNQIS